MIYYKRWETNGHLRERRAIFPLHLCGRSGVTFTLSKFIPQLPFCFHPILFCVLLYSFQTGPVFKNTSKNGTLPHTDTHVNKQAVFEDGGATCGMHGERVIIRRCRLKSSAIKIQPAYQLLELSVGYTLVLFQVGRLQYKLFRVSIMNCYSC